MVCITSEGPDVFYTAVQGSQYCNTAEHSLCLLANHSSVLACPRHNISALQLISVHSRIIKSHSSFPVLHLQNLLAGATVAVQQPAKNSSPYQPLPSAYTFKENRALLWHLEFEIACIHLHVENRLKSLFFSFFFQHFPRGTFELRCLWHELNQRGGCFASWIRVQVDPSVKVKPTPSYCGLQPESFSTVVKLNCNLILKWFPSHSRHLCKST